MMSAFALSLLWSVSTSDFCRDLGAERVKGAIAIAPLTCEPQAAGICAEITQKLVRCLKRTSKKVVEPGAIKAAFEELALKQAQGDDATAVLLELVGGMGATHLVTTDLSPDKTVALLRLVGIEDGAVLSAVRLPVDDNAEQGPITYATIDSAMTQLADRLVGALTKIQNSGRKRRIAVLKFSESGAIASKNGMGTLSSAELVTRFRRDHDIVVVERSRLDQVLKEFELGQLGLVDANAAPKLGKMLDAEAIVLGSVSDAGPQIRVHAQLIDVSTGVTLAADSVSLQSATMVALSSDAVVLRTKSGALFRSLIIPGWGQMYNRQTVKGGVILGAVLALAGGAGAMQIVSTLATNDYKNLGPGANFDAAASRAENFAIARTVLLSVMGAVWIYNIIDAYVNGVTFDAATSSGAGGALTLTPAGLSGRF